MAYRLQSSCPAMAAYEWKVQESSGCSVYKAACHSWSVVYAGIPKEYAPVPVKERMRLLARCKPAGRATVCFLHVLIWLPADCVTQIKGVSGSRSAKSLCCSCRGPRLSSWHTHGGSQPSVTVSCSRRSMALF